MQWPKAERYDEQASQEEEEEACPAALLVEPLANPEPAEGLQS